MSAVSIEVPAAAPIVSEWPAALILDELWLRSRRLLVYELERRGVWPSDSVYRRTIVTENDRGKELERTVLARALSPSLLRLLGSDSIFAAANRRFRTRLPLSLSFGHSLGRCLAAARAEEESRIVPAYELAALFNAGISIFDLLHDTMPAAADSFSGYFNRAVLSSLHDERRSDLAAEKGTPSAEPEIELLLRIIATFYAELRAYAAARSDASVAGAMSLLMAAYDAEMASTRPQACRPAHRLRISREKSMLPFRIIKELGWIGRETGEARPLLDCLAENVGTLFWLTDDLADVVDDLRCGAVNAIVARVTTRVSTLDPATAARLVVSSRSIERAVRDIMRAFDSIVSVAGHPLLDGTAATELPALTVCYIRNWIE